VVARLLIAGVAFLDMMSRMERQLEADLFGTSNTPEEVGGFGYFRPNFSGEPDG